MRYRLVRIAPTARSWGARFRARSSKAKQALSKCRRDVALHLVGQGHASDARDNVMMDEMTMHDSLSRHIACRDHLRVVEPHSSDSRALISLRASAGSMTVAPSRR